MRAGLDSYRAISSGSVRVFVESSTCKQENEGQERHVNLTHNACDTRHVGYACSQLLRGAEGLGNEEDLAGATPVDVEVQIPRSICLLMLPRDVVPDTLEQDIELVNKDGYS